MPEILIVNPNTTGTITALLQRHGDQQLAPQASVRAVTARFGAPYIVDEASFAVASHATLDAWAAALAEGAAPDAVLIGCFGDPGLAALRDSSAAPVTGLAEAAVLEAAALGRFAHLLQRSLPFLVGSLLSVPLAGVFWPDRFDLGFLGLYALTLMLAAGLHLASLRRLVRA